MTTTLPVHRTWWSGSGSGWSSATTWPRSTRAASRSRPRSTRTCSGPASSSLAAGLAQVESLPGYRWPRYDAAAARPLSPRTSYLQGLLVALDPSTGDVLALEGGRDFRDSEFNRAVQSRRQAGSTFKPFVYTAALGQGLPPTMLLDDGPLSLPAGGAACSRQDGDKQRQRRRVVHRLHAGLRGRRVDGIRPTADDHASSFRRDARGTDLGGLRRLSLRRSSDPAGVAAAGPGRAPGTAERRKPRTAGYHGRQLHRVFPRGDRAHGARRRRAPAQAVALRALRLVATVPPATDRSSRARSPRACRDSRGRRRAPGRESRPDGRRAGASLPPAGPRAPARSPSAGQCR